MVRYVDKGGFRKGYHGCEDSIREDGRHEEANARAAGRKMAACVLMVAMLGVLSGCTGGSTTVCTAPNEHVVTVNAISEVQVEPDMVRVGVSVTTQGADAASVQEGNAEAVDAVMAALKDAGVTEASILTSHAYLDPVYSEWQEPALEGDAVA